MNYRMISYTLGWVLNFEAIAMILPLLCGIYYGDASSVTVFTICVGICLCIGRLLTFKKPENKTMYAKEGFVAVALCWIFLSIFGALPFVISGYIPNFIDALFETVSGFTTTGASILTNIEALPRALLFWRSFTHWLGGMGVLVLLVAILPLSGGNNMHLIRAESPGPSVGKIVPKVKSMAKILYLIYFGMTVLEIMLLLAGGLDVFSSLTLSFGTAGTGGFGILNSSIASYSSYVQVVITVFMILFGVDFSLYYLLLAKKFAVAFKSEEYRAYLGIFAIATVIITFNCLPMFQNILTSLKHSAFQVASIMTTTGYATTDFNLWPSLSKTILVILMFIGACAGSTGGGLKVSRVLILLKASKREIKIAAHPRSTHTISLNGRVIEQTTVRNVTAYFAIFMLVFVASLLVISLDGYDFTTNFTSVAATINNIGPGLELVGPTGNFSSFSPLSKIVFIFDMLVGRLEIFPMLILFSPLIYKK